MRVRQETDREALTLKSANANFPLEFCAQMPFRDERLFIYSIIREICNESQR